MEEIPSAMPAAPQDQPPKAEGQTAESVHAAKSEAGLSSKGHDDVKAETKDNLLVPPAASQDIKGSIKVKEEAGDITASRLGTPSQQEELSLRPWAAAKPPSKLAPVTTHCKLFASFGS